jgi:hypothetical protein
MAQMSRHTWGQVLPFAESSTDDWVCIRCIHIGFVDPKGTGDAETKSCPPPDPSIKLLVQPVILADAELSEATPQVLSEFL